MVEDYERALDEIVRSRGQRSIGKLVAPTAKHSKSSSIDILRYTKQEEAKYAHRDPNRSAQGSKRHFRDILRNMH